MHYGIINTAAYSAEMHGTIIAAMILSRIAFKPLARKTL